MDQFPVDDVSPSGISTYDDKPKCNRGVSKRPLFRDRDNFTKYVFYMLRNVSYERINCERSNIPFEFFSSFHFFSYEVVSND